MSSQSIIRHSLNVSSVMFWNSSKVFYHHGERDKTWYSTVPGNNGNSLLCTVLWLIPRGWDFLSKPVVAQLVKKCHAIYWTWNVITVCTSDTTAIVCMQPAQSTPQPPTLNIHFTASSHLRTGIRRGLMLQRLKITLVFALVAENLNVKCFLL